MTKPNIGFGLALAMLGGIVLLSYHSTQSVAAAAEARRRGSTRVDQLQEFLAAAIDVETGQRGYLVTGDAAFLEPYHSGMARLDPELQGLHVALADDPRQQADLADLREAVAQLVRYHRHVISLEADHDRTAARLVVAAGRGKQIMDRIRQLITALRAEERVQLQQREEEFQAGLRWNMLMIIAGSGVAFMAVGLAGVAINRSLRERNRLTAELRMGLAENVQILDKLRVATADLTRSNQELEQFAYVASHDLQEPLRKVSSFAQLLAAQYKEKLDADGNEFLGYMLDGAQRMQTLIRNLLAYSRLGRKGKPFGPADGNAVLELALENLQAAVEESGAVVTSAALPTVHADQGQLVQLFQNLIGNAIKFHGPEKPRIHVSAVPSPPGWTFSVRDNGIGIDPQFAERIFIIFQRLHSREDYPGTGIGLSLCKKIVERHGGRIWMETQSAPGTDFRFTLPRTPPKENSTHDLAHASERDRNLAGGR